MSFIYIYTHICVTLSWQSGPHLGHLGTPLGHLASHLGHLGPHLGHLGPHLEHLGLILAILGFILGHLEAIRSHLATKSNTKQKQDKHIKHRKQISKQLKDH